MWSKSQEALIKLAGQKIDGGELDIIQIHEFQSGVTKTLKFIEGRSRNEKRFPRSIVLDGVRGWDTVVSLTKKAEIESKDVGGLGYLDRLHTALKVLSGEGERSMMLWLEESRLMRPVERETIVAHLDYISNYLRIPVRTVFIVGKVMLWDTQKNMRVPSFPPFSNRLRDRATLYDFHKSGMEESELIEDVPTQTQQNQERIVKITA